MRTLLILLIGLVVVVAGAWLTRPIRRRLAAAVFTVSWLVAMALNLRLGLSHGYSLTEELPLHILLFVVPVAAAWAFSWRRRLP